MTCPKTGKPHMWGTDGMHQNEFCKDCFITKPDLRNLKPCPLCKCETMECHEGNNGSQVPAIYCTACPYGVQDATKTLAQLVEYHNRRPEGTGLTHADDWEEEYGDCIFFHFFSFEEPPEVWCGSPLDCDFDKEKWTYFIRVDFNEIFRQVEDDLQP